MKTYLVALAACAGIGAMTFGTSALSGTTSTSSSFPNTEIWWQKRLAEKQIELHRQTVQLVFLGDSILHSFEWDPKAPLWKRWYGGRGAVDLGYNGDLTANVLWRVQHGELDGVAPKLVVILIGTNDIGRRPAGVIADGIETLVQAIRTRLPSTEILVLGILPTGRPTNEEAVARAVNRQLASVYAHPGAAARYQDVACVFRRHGHLNAELFREKAVPGVSYPLHPTPEGMNLLAARIEPTVAAALGDPVRTRAADAADTDCDAGG